MLVVKIWSLECRPLTYCDSFGITIVYHISPCLYRNLHDLLHKFLIWPAPENPVSLRVFHVREVSGSCSSDVKFS